MKIAVAIFFLWIGALKFVPYEADSITPFVANSPAMSFFYQHPTEYKAHLTHEGELKPAERVWQTANNTYGFSTGLGTLELVIGGLTLAGLVYHRVGIVGAALAFATPFVTLIASDWSSRIPGRDWRRRLLTASSTRSSRRNHRAWGSD